MAAAKPPTSPTPPKAAPPPTAMTPQMPSIADKPPSPTPPAISPKSAPAPTPPKAAPPSPPKPMITAAPPTMPTNPPMTTSPPKPTSPPMPMPTSPPKLVVPTTIPKAIIPSPPMPISPPMPTSPPKAAPTAPPKAASTAPPKPIPTSPPTPPKPTMPPPLPTTQPPATMPVTMIPTKMPETTTGGQRGRTRYTVTYPTTTYLPSFFTTLISAIEHQNRFGETTISKPTQPPSTAKTTTMPTTAIPTTMMKSAPITISMPPTTSPPRRRMRPTTTFATTPLYNMITAFDDYMASTRKPKKPVTTTTTTPKPTQPPPPPPPPTPRLPTITITTTITPIVKAPASPPPPPPPSVVSITAAPPKKAENQASQSRVEQIRLPPVVSTTIASTSDAMLKMNLKHKKLTEQQKKDLETLETLEKEQAAIIEQLNFLTGLINPGSGAKGGENLADRVIAMAKNTRSTTPASAAEITPNSYDMLQSLTTRSPRQLNKGSSPPSVEELVKQININELNSVTPQGPVVASTYGKTNDALLASLLKEYGVGPTTPKGLEGIFTSTKKPRPPPPQPTQRPPGRLMQGLNWLLNTLVPPVPATRRPRPKPRPKPAVVEEDELNGEPTSVTPVVRRPPAKVKGQKAEVEGTNLSQEQLRDLIFQLEAIKDHPEKAKNLDLTSLRELQSAPKASLNSVNGDDGIQVITASSLGASSRTTRAPKISSTDYSEADGKGAGQTRGRGTRYRTTTSSPPYSVSNSIQDDVQPTTRGKVRLRPVDFSPIPGVADDIEAATARTKLPPVKLKSVPGVPDANPRIRGQLVNYAINVTKSISQFLGTALQGASRSLLGVLSSGSGGFSQYLSSSTQPEHDGESTTS